MRISSLLPRLSGFRGGGSLSFRAAFPFSKLFSGIDVSESMEEGRAHPRSAVFLKQQHFEIGETTMENDSYADRQANNNGRCNAL